MLSFFKKAPQTTGTALEQTMRKHLRNVDEDGLHGVVAVAGLVVKIAMEDEELAGDEEALIRNELGKVGSLGPAGVDAVVSVMREHARAIAEVETADYAAWLGEHRERAFCLAVLELLVDVARAHAGIEPRELDGLGRIARDMKLSPDDLARLLPA